MSQRMSELRPLYLSAEEAMGLLDLCLLSGAEFDRDAEGVLLKLSDLVRQHLAAVAEEACELQSAREEDPRNLSNREAPECLRSADPRLVALQGTDLVAAPTKGTRYSGLKPCPAGSLRSWPAMPSQ